MIGDPTAAPAPDILSSDLISGMGKVRGDEGGAGGIYKKDAGKWNAWRKGFMGGSVGGGSEL